MLRGILPADKGSGSVTPGYAGGDTKNPDYYSVGTKTTGHAEVVKVVFDPAVIQLVDVLDVFWLIHDPTSLNKQGNDVGPQYRSIILFKDDQQKKIIESSIKKVQPLHNKAIVTEVKMLDRFYEAEPEHHNYFKNHPQQAYCQLTINPKLAKLREKYKTLLR